MSGSHITDETVQKARAEATENINAFCNQVREVVMSAEGKVPMDIVYMQMSFWANVFMKQMIETAQATPTGTTIN